MKLKKGSKAAKAFMARIRAMKKNKSPRARANKEARRKADFGKRMYKYSPGEYRRAVEYGMKPNPRKRRTKKNPARYAKGAGQKLPHRNGYVLTIGTREMAVTGISQDEAKALAKKIARFEGRKVTVREGKI